MLDRRPDPDPTRMAKSPRQASLRRAHALLERELSGLLRPEVLDALLASRTAELASDPDGEAGNRLRARVGADLLDAIGDALSRVALELPVCPSEEPARRAPAGPALDATRCLAPSASDPRRARERTSRRWTPTAELSRRVG